VLQCLKQAASKHAALCEVDPDGILQCLVETQHTCLPGGDSAPIFDECIKGIVPCSGIEDGLLGSDGITLIQCVCVYA